MPFLRRFASIVTAAIAAVSILASSAAPAHAAEPEDIAKAIAAIAALAIIANQIDKNNDRDDDRDDDWADRRDTDRAQVWRPRDDNRWRDNGRWESERRWHDTRRAHARQPALPAACAFRIDTRERSSIGYSERCLDRAGFGQRLPRDCRIDMRGNDRDRYYGARCLEGAGFRTDRRGHDR